VSGAFLENDLTAILDIGDFAVNAVWTEGATTINGIFEDADVEVDRHDGARHIQRATTFQTKSSHGIEKGDTLTIGAVAYVVVVIEQDGTGAVILHLEKS